MKSIFGILLALIILVTQSGFVYQAHYCGDEVVEEHVGFMFDDISCGMSDKVSKDCSQGSNGESIEQSTCCKNVNTYNKLNTDRDFSFVSLQLEKYIVSQYNFSNLFDFHSLKVPVQLKSNPPPGARENCNLSNHLSQAAYLAYIQSYLC